ncbi:MAG: SDR family oxidoreductase, partial [Bacteriovoracaceae bacterium]
MQGRKALITGGTKGLGFATAKQLAAKGVDLFLAYRKDESNAKIAQATIQKEYNVNCTIFACDLALEGQAEVLFNEVKQVFNNKLDYYVHNAAATAFKDLLELEAHHVDKTFNLTIKSFILGVKHAVKMMEQGGAIVTVSGMDTLKAVPKHGLLGAAKAALE